MNEKPCWVVLSIFHYFWRYIYILDGYFEGMTYAYMCRFLYYIRLIVNSLRIDQCLRAIPACEFQVQIPVASRVR